MKRFYRYTAILIFFYGAVIGFGGNITLSTYDMVAACFVLLYSKEL